MANIRVAVRVRPLNEREAATDARNIINTHGNSLAITNVKVEGTAEYGDTRERVKHFTFDYCYDSNIDTDNASADFASQELVYQDLGTEVLQAAFDGYNACLFAYGQTGTGKTFTMMGYPGEIGLTPRICEGLFSHVDDCPEENITFRVEISYLEIYNERVRDLLRTSLNPERFTLRVREHPKDGPYVQDLSRHQVKDYHEIQTLLDRGNQLRTTASTHMHDHSSRSHAIVTVTFTQAKLEDGMPSETVSKVHLVDLAGSERADPNYHANYKGQIREGANINKSLYTLGYVIKGLAEKSLLAWSSGPVGSNQDISSEGESQEGVRKPRPLYIPYRDSVLTWLLKDSLGGNSKTLMIATDKKFVVGDGFGPEYVQNLSEVLRMEGGKSVDVTAITPASKYYGETISTLRYAQRAKSIVNQPRINEDGNVSLIRQLRQEIERLKQMLQSAGMSHSAPHNEIVYLLSGKDRFLTFNQSGIESSEGEVVMSEQDAGASLSEKLKENEAMANKLTQSWLNKWSETQTLMQDTDLSIRGLGRRSSSYGVIIDSQLPHLIGMDDDILSTGVIIFHLKEGKTLIGREDARREQDIVLDGPGIQSEHCHVKNEEGQVILYPHHGAQCTVNGVLVHEATPLTQGDVLLLGKTSMYRFNNPAQAAKLRQRRQSMQEGELSAASSVVSLSEPEGIRASPLRLFNPHVELEHAFTNEEDRIQHAKNELARIRGELSVREEAGQEEEEALWAQHEKHREELEAEKIRLAHLKDRLLRLEHRAEQSSCLHRDQLDEQDQAYQQHLQEQLGLILQHDKGGDSTAQQTDTEQSSLSTQTEFGTTNTADVTYDVAITGPVGQEIQQRKLSLQGRVKGLAQSELLHNFSQRQALQDLQSQEEEMEEEILQSRKEVEIRILKIQEKEQQYHGVDASRLDSIRQQKEQLEELQRQEEQLELYLEEKQDLLAVGQAQPHPLRSARSELVLSAASTTPGALCSPAVRATSETNIGECIDSGMELVQSDPNMSASNDSLDDSSKERSWWPGPHPDFSVSDGQSWPFKHPATGSVERDQSKSSQFPGSDMDFGEELHDSMDSVESSDSPRVYPTSRSVQGRGRSMLRTGRGRSKKVQSQGQGKPETFEDKKLTSLAKEVTSRLYQPKTVHVGSQGKSPSTGLDREGSFHSPTSRSSPCPKPSSKSHSPRSPTAGKKPAFQYSPEGVQKKSRNKDEWDRPWRTRPAALNRSREESELQSGARQSLDKNRENWDRPWRQGRPPALHSARSQSAAMTGSGREGRKAVAKENREDDPSCQAVSSSPRALIKARLSQTNPQAPSRARSRDNPLRSAKKDRETGGQRKDLSGSLPPRYGSEDSLTSSKSDISGSKRQPLGGSDSSLTSSQRHQPYRPRSRLRQISSASSLPSVPEATAENETDLDSAPMTSNANMAALVAAVPRRQKRGRRNLKEEEERCHSEPVGHQWAQALAQMEDSMGQEGLNNKNSASSGSLQQSIPQIHVTEPSSSSSDGTSSQESVQPVLLEHSSESAQPEDDKWKEDHPTEDMDTQQCSESFNKSQEIASSVIFPKGKAGEKREYGESNERWSPTEILLKKKKSTDRDEECDAVSGDLTNLTERGDQSAAITVTGTALSGCSQGAGVGGHDCLSADRKGSDSSYSSDSLDEGDGIRKKPEGNTHSFAVTGESSEMETISGRTTFTVPNVGNVQLDYHTGVHEEGTGSFSLHGDISTRNTCMPAGQPVSQNAELLHGSLSTSILEGRVCSQRGMSTAPATGAGPSTDKRHLGEGPTETTKSSPKSRQLTVSQTLVWHSEITDRPNEECLVSISEKTIDKVEDFQGASDVGLYSTSDQKGSPAEISSVSIPSDTLEKVNASRACSGPTELHAEMESSRTNMEVHISGQVATDSMVSGRTADLEEGSRYVGRLGTRTAGGGGEVSESCGQVPVTMEMLTMLAREEEGSQMSDETTSSHVEKEIQAWQEVLQQLSPRTSAAAAQTGNTGNNGRRGKRRQHSRHVKDSDSDNADHLSDESPASGTNSRSSSRPSSGSRRRRRPASKASETVVKKQRGHSSEEYVSSDNNSIFSDDSLTHSSERQETCTSQISDLRNSIQQLTEGLEQCDVPTADHSSQQFQSNTMEEQAEKSVPALVTYFESQMKQPPDGTENREQSPGGVWQMNVPELSVQSDEGSSSACEATQTEGSNIVMGKAPMSILSAGDPDYLVSNGVLQEMSGSQSIQEVTSIKSQSWRSWKLSISPTDTWQSQIELQPQCGIEEEQTETAQFRRKSKGDNTSIKCPEKRQRQDRLTDLHSKYGLMDEADPMTDDEDLQGTTTAVSGQGQSLQEGQVSSHAQKKRHTVKMDSDGKLLFEVTINQDETNVLYNVETTEYNTYSLKDNGDTPVSQELAGGYFPDSININLTETTTLQREDRFETVSNERVIFEDSISKNDRNDGVVFTENKFTRGHSLRYEQESGRESSVECNLTDEESISSLKMKSSQESLMIDPSSPSVSVQLETNDSSETRFDAYSTHTAVSSTIVIPSATHPQQKYATQNRRSEAHGTGHWLDRDNGPDSLLKMNNDKKGTGMEPLGSSSSAGPGSWSMGVVSVSDFQADSGFTEVSASESLTSHDGDGVESKNKDIVSVSTSTGPSKRTALTTEGVSNTFHKNESKDVASQLHQTIAPHEQDYTEYVSTHNVSKPDTATTEQSRYTHILHPGKSYLQVEMMLPDTPPPVKNLSGGNHHSGTGHRHRHDSSHHQITSGRDVTTVRAQDQSRMEMEGLRTVGIESSQDLPAKQTVEVAVLHPDSGSFTFPQRAEGSEHRMPEAESLSILSQDSLSRTGHLFGRPGQTPSPGFLSLDKVSKGNKDEPIAIYMAESRKVTDDMEQKHDHRARENRPSVEEVPKESFGRLPRISMEHGSQSPLMYPYCQDSLVPHTSSSCSKEPYSWVDTFMKERTQASSITSPSRSSRLTSEEAAEALLVEVKGRESTHHKEEDQVFIEGIVTLSQQTVVTGTGSKDESHQGDTVSSNKISSRSKTNQNTQVLSEKLIEPEGPVLMSGDSFGRPRTIFQSEERAYSQTDTDHQSQAKNLPMTTVQTTQNRQEESLLRSETVFQDGAGSIVNKTLQQSSTECSVSNTAQTSRTEPGLPHSGVGAILTSAKHASPEIQASLSPPTVASAGHRTERSRGLLMDTEPSVLTAVAAVVERQLMGAGGAGGVEAIRQVLKQEVEQKIALLQRRVRSLSDSAISSDFTEPESASVSPRNSRIPVCDIKMETLVSGASPLEAFCIQSEDGRGAHFVQHSAEKAGGNSNEKSLEDSGNIHDYQWQDPEDNGFIHSETVHSGGSDGNIKSPLNLRDATRTQPLSTIPNLTCSRMPREFENQWEEANRHFAISIITTDSSSGKGKEKQLHQEMHWHSPVTLSQTTKHQLPSNLTEHVKDAYLSVQQTWPASAFQSYSHLRRKRRGLLGRRTKSANNLTELDTARESSHLEETVLEQAKVILHAARISGAVDAISPAVSVGSESGRVEKTGDTLSSHPPFSDRASHSSFQKLAAEDRHHPDILGSVSNQAVRSILNAATSGTSSSQTIKPQDLGHVGSLQQRGSQKSKHPSLESVSSTYPVYGSSRAPSLSDTSEVATEQTEEKPQDQGVQFTDIDSEGQASDDYLLTSGELEVAAINAARNLHVETEVASRVLSPGEEILAEILARQWEVTPLSKTSDTSDAGSRLYPLMIRGASPIHRPQPRREDQLSADDLSLSKETLQLLQHSEQVFEGSETMIGLSLSESFGGLDCEELSVGQLKMLQCKAVSASSLGPGFYLHNEEDQDLLIQQIERPVSLACLEGLVLDDTAEDSSSSADSICFVFMGQQSLEVDAKLSVRGDSVATSEGSERLAFHSRSTESLVCEREAHVPPFSEHSVSMDNIHAASSNIQYKLRLHRSRSASLLDVAAPPVDDSADHENIFPPNIDTDSDTSLDNAEIGKEAYEKNSISHSEDPSQGESIITNPAFIHRPSLIEPSAEQHLYLTSPTQLYTSGPASGSRNQPDIYQYTGDDTRSVRRSEIVEVESGEPYFRYHAAGAKPCQSENGAQTEESSSPELSESSAQSQKCISSEQTSPVSAVQTDFYHTDGRSQQLNNQTSENRKDWMGASPAPKYYDVCESAATQTEPFESSKPSFSKRMASQQQMENLGRSVDTGTQTPPFSPRVIYSGHSTMGLSLEPQTIVVKVKDSGTQTSSSLVDLSTTEVQTVNLIDEQSAGSLRPTTRNAYSTTDEMAVTLTASSYQMNELLPGVTSHRVSHGTGINHHSTLPHVSETGPVPGLRDQQDMSSVDDVVHSRYIPNQAEVPGSFHSRVAHADIGDPHPTGHREELNIIAGNLSSLTREPDSRQVSVCTQLSLDSHLRYITVQDARTSNPATRRNNSESSTQSSQERGSLHESVDSKNGDEDKLKEQYIILCDTQRRQGLPDQFGANVPELSSTAVQSSAASVPGDDTADWHVQSSQEPVQQTTFPHQEMTQLGSTQSRQSRDKMPFARSQVEEDLTFAHVPSLTSKMSTHKKNASHRDPQKNYQEKRPEIIDISADAVSTSQTDLCTYSRWAPVQSSGKEHPNYEPSSTGDLNMLMGAAAVFLPHSEEADSSVTTFYSAPEEHVQSVSLSLSAATEHDHLSLKQTSSSNFSIKTVKSAGDVTDQVDKLSALSQQLRDSLDISSGSALWEQQGVDKRSDLRHQNIEHVHAHLERNLSPVSPVVQRGSTSEVHLAPVSPVVQTGSTSEVLLAPVSPAVQTGSTSEVHLAPVSPVVQTDSSGEVHMAPVSPVVQAGSTSEVHLAPVSPVVQAGSASEVHLAPVSPVVQTGSASEVHLAPVSPVVQAGSTSEVHLAPVSPAVQRGSSGEEHLSPVSPVVQTGSTSEVHLAPVSPVVQTGSSGEEHLSPVSPVVQTGSTSEVHLAPVSPLVQTGSTSEVHLAPVSPVVQIGSSGEEHLSPVSPVVQTDSTSEVHLAPVSPVVQTGSSGKEHLSPVSPVVKTDSTSVVHLAPVSPVVQTGSSGKEHLSPVSPVVKTDSTSEVHLAPVTPVVQTGSSGEEHLSPVSPVVKTDSTSEVHLAPVSPVVQRGSSGEEHLSPVSPVVKTGSTSEVHLAPVSPVVQTGSSDEEHLSPVSPVVQRGSSGEMHLALVSPVVQTGSSGEEHLSLVFSAKHIKNNDLDKEYSGNERKTNSPAVDKANDVRVESGVNGEGTVEEVGEVLSKDHIMPLEHGPVLAVPCQPLFHAEKSCSEPEAELPMHRSEGKPRDRKPGRGRSHDGERSYRREERLELSRSQITRPRHLADFHNHSFSDNYMFVSDAQQRAAWRARMGDFSLSASPASSDMNRLHALPLISESRRRQGSSPRGTTRTITLQPLPQQAEISSEIEKLRQEHARMMDLLERSRGHSSPLLSQLLRTRSASPRITHAGSGSSSSGSFITVIAGRGSVRESPNGVMDSGTLSRPSSQEEPWTDHRESSEPLSDHSTSSKATANSSHPNHISDIDNQMPGEHVDITSRTTACTLVEPNTSNRNASARNLNSEEATRAQVQNSALKQTASRESDYLHERSLSQTQNHQGLIKEDLPCSSRGLPALSISDLSSRPDQHQTVVNVSTNPQNARTSARSLELEDSAEVTISVLSPRLSDSPFHRQHDLEAGKDPDSHHVKTTTTPSWSASSAARGRRHPRSELSQQKLNKDQMMISDDIDTLMVPYFPYTDDESSDVNSRILPTDGFFLHPSVISTGVEATVDSSDDFTQTDVEEENLRLIQLDSSRDSVASSDASNTHRIRAELDRLQQERVEIIELLSLQYLPASLTVELLEAKLNYCLGQTDMLLATLEKAWSCDESDDWKQKSRKRHEIYLAEYRQQFEQSREDIKICMEEARRIHSGARGRRKTRTRDVLSMRRRTQIEAFKQERRREQALFHGHRSFSPGQSGYSSSTSEDPSQPSTRFAPHFMTPRQRKEHLVNLRRSVVAASSEELDELRQRSRSSSISRSPTPDFSVSPASSRSNMYPSRDSSLGSSLSPDRSMAPRYDAFRSIAPVHAATTPIQSQVNPGCPRRIPRLVLPSEDQASYRGHSFPRQSQSLLEPRSISCDPALPPRHNIDFSHLIPPDVHSLSFSGFPSSNENDNLDPEQLLRESYEARQLNRQQISKAQEALRLLEEHRRSFRSNISSALEVRSRGRHATSSRGMHSVTFSDQNLQRAGGNMHEDGQRSSASSAGLDWAGTSVSLHESSVPPDFTSTPRSTNYFATYAKDVLTRSERHIQTIMAQSSSPDQGHSISSSDMPSSFQSTDLDSYLDMSSTSGTRSSPRFTSSRPISSQDIKARIARRMQDKKTTKD